MRRRAAPRGQPLIALVALLSGWVAVRAAIWEPPFALAGAAPVEPLEMTTADAQAVPAAVADRQTAAASERVTSPPAWQPPPAPLQARPPAPAVAPQPVPVPVGIAAGHQMLWLAALSRLPLPPELAGLQSATPARPGAVPPLYRAPERKTARWSVDGWMLWRRDGTGGARGGLAPASYGASQAGAVIRYRLAPNAAHRPVLYLRASTALASPRDEEVAVGLAARPFGKVPLVAAAELRATRLGGREVLRPALALVTEFPPLELPLGARAEIYGQAGYVAGTGATAFVDGQLRIDRPVARTGRFELRAGGGAWGGAQVRAGRLDIGPSATLGTGAARVAVDWRFRVVGTAAPASGPTVTLSAGF